MNIITLVTKNKIIVETRSQFYIKALKAMGAKQRGFFSLNSSEWVLHFYRIVLKPMEAIKRGFYSSEWVIQYDSKEELATIFSKLRDLGFLFAGGSSGWPPSAIFAELKDQGLIHGDGVEVVWKGPNDPCILIIK